MYTNVIHSDNQDQQSIPHAPRRANQIRCDDEKIPIFRTQLMNNHEQLHGLTEIVNMDPVDDILKSFTTYMYENSEQVFGTNNSHAPTHRKPNTQHSEWFNNECRTTKKEFKAARNIFLRSKKDDDRLSFVKMRTKYNRVKRKAKCKFKRSEGKNVCNLAKSNPKKFWKSIKKRYNKKSPQSDILRAQNFFEHFKEMYGGQDEQSQQNEQPDLGSIEVEELDSEISSSELREAIFSQKNGKSCGLDHLCAELFKHSFDIISPFLLKLFNRLFSNGEYPKSWGEGIIVPIFKSGNPDEAQNYRGITLINVLGKVYSQVLLNRLSKWSEENDKLSKNQFGFQKGKSTIDCVFLLNAIVSKVINSGEKLYCCFIDYEKAFDRIDRPLLWHKLIFEKVSSKLVKALKSMYDVVRACIRYKSLHSRFFNSYTGLKQGDPSSPLLFMMFINDLIDNMNSNLENVFTTNELVLFMILYADDAVVFAKSKETLQSLLHDIELYCGIWGLKVNTKKTKVMIFERGRHTSCDLFLNNTKLEVVDSFKYLGVHFFKNGNWFRTQKRLAQHASYALHNLFSLFRQIDIPITEQCKLFDTLVGSILNYSSEVWGIHNAKDVEAIHSKFCRWVLNVKKSTNLSGLYGELGRVPFIIQRKINMIKYWAKLLKSSDTFLPKRIYIMLKEDADSGNTYNGSNWASHIKSMLNNLGFSYIWLHQTDITIPLNAIKQRIYDSYSQSWYAEINNSNRLITYARYKHEFAFESYLDFISEEKYKIVLTRFRLSSHELHIERGRYENVPRDERICKCCNMSQIESEYHFLLVCPLYTELRRKFFKPYFCHWPNLNKFDQLMLSNSKQVTLSIAKFIFSAQELRKSVLNP